MPDDVPVDPFTLTPEQATARLAEIHAARHPPPSATPSTPAEATARLRVLATDKSWGERFLNGSAAERREFTALTEMASGDQTTSDGIVTVDSVTDPHALSPRVYNGLIDGLREQGLPASAEQYIRDVDAGVRTDLPTQGDGVACKQALDRLVKSTEFRERVLSGEPQATNLKNALDRVIAYASNDDGVPVSEYVRKYLADLGLR